MANKDFLKIAEIGFFLACIWCFGRLFRILDIAPLLGEILVGIILGPQVLNIVPFANPDEFSIWQIFGTIGVALLIAESGAHVSFNKLFDVGKQAGIIAFYGAFFSLIIGMCLGMFHCFFTADQISCAYLKCLFFSL